MYCEIGIHNQNYTIIKCILRCKTMYDYVWLCMTLYDIWLCITMYDYMWLCMTMYDYMWLWERERERQREQF